MCKALEILEQTYSRWRREYEGTKTTQAKKLKALEKIKYQAEEIGSRYFVGQCDFEVVALKKVISPAWRR